MPSFHPVLAIADALQRVQARKEVVDQLIVGNLPLIEAAARFRGVGPYGDAELEHTCREMIGWACLAMGDRPERAEVRGLELEQELLDYLELTGSNELPTV